MKAEWTSTIHAMRDAGYLVIQRHDRATGRGRRMKPERIANKSARGMVQMRRPFEGSNLYAREATPQHGMSTLYVVYSYGEHFPIYVAETDEGNNTVWYETADKYSQSTSRHQSQCNPLENTIKLTAGAMRRCAVEGIAGVAAMGELG